MSLGGGVGNSAMNLLTWFTLAMEMVILEMVMVVMMITTMVVALVLLVHLWTQGMWVK